MKTNNFESVEDLIASCKLKNSVLWKVIKDLEQDFNHNRDINNTIEQLEEIHETLDALIAVTFSE